MKANKAKKVNIGKHQSKNSEKEMKTESVGLGFIEIKEICPSMKRKSLESRS